MQEAFGITTIYVTHDQIEAITIAHRVAILKKVVVQQLATSSEIYNNPTNLFVAQFIASPTMNIMSAIFRARPPSRSHGLRLLIAENSALASSRPFLVGCWL